MRLLREKDERSDYACIGAVRVIEVRDDNSVILDREYIPPSLDCRDTPRLAGFIEELQGLLKQRLRAGVITHAPVHQGEVVQAGHVSGMLLSQN